MLQDVSAVTGACLMVKALMRKQAAWTKGLLFPLNDVGLLPEVAEMGIWNVFILCGTLSL